MKKNYILTLFLSLLISGLTFGQTLMITTISDGDCTGGVPKMVEIYVQGEVNLSQYSLKNLSISSTAGTSSLNSFGTVTDDFIYVYYDNTSEEVFATEYPSATTSIEATVANFNGDDVIRIVRNSDQTIIDQYGDTDGGTQDGTGTPWEYKDGYAKRINGTTSSGEFTIGDWTVVNGGLDGQGSCQGGTIFEDVMDGIGTYTPPLPPLEDFEADLPTSALKGDSGVAVSVVPDPETGGTHGQVLKVESSTTYVNSSGNTVSSQTYQNAQYIFQNDGLDMSTTDKILTIDVYSETATDVLAKLELGTGGASDTQVDTSTPHSGNGWETLSFNFSNGVTQNGSSNPANGVYGKLVLFPLWNGDDFNAASVTTTYYDNISGLAYVPPAQNITVSVDHSTFLSNPNAGVNIRVYNSELDENNEPIGFQEFITVEDTENPNIHSYTFAEGVTSATYLWRVYGSDTPTDENLVSLVKGGGVENNLGEAIVLGDNNGIDTDYETFCSRTVTSTSGNYEAPTTYFNSLQKVGVDYTELVLTADAGDDYVLDYSVNNFEENHGPGATDNGNGTYTVIVDPSSAFQYKWNNLTTSTQEDLSGCTDGEGVANDGTYSNRTHTAGEDKEDTFGVCPTNSQTITVSVDVSNGNLTGIAIRVYDPVAEQFGASIAAVQDPTDSNRWSHTFADGVTSARYYWEFFNPATFTPQGESLLSLVQGGGVENDLAATLGDNNGILTNYSTYCDRTVTSDSGDYVAPTFKFNSFQQVGVTYTELVLNAASGSSYAINYSKNSFDVNHGPGALDNGDDTYTVIVDPSSTFTYLWYNRTTSTQEDLTSCTDGSGVANDGTYSNRTHAAGNNKEDTFNVCPTSETIVLQDFSNLENTAGEDVYGGFGDGLTATNALVDGPVDASNKVRTVTTTAGGNTWKGVFFRPQTHYIDLTSTKTVSVKVYSTTASYFKGKIQAGQSSQGDIELTTSEAHTGSGWETLTFTFPTATGEWGELVIYTNVDANGALIDPAVEVLEAHFDDLTAAQGSEVPAPAAGPTTAATAPTAGAADVISIFSDSYTGTAPASWSQEWGDGTLEDDLVIDGNTSKHYSDLLFQAINLNGNVDLSSYTTVHIDVYTESANVFKFKLQNFGANGTDEYPNADDTEAEVVSPTAQTAGEWVSHDIPLSSFIGDGKLDSAAAIGQIQIVLGEKADIWIDNIYFYKEPTASETTVLQDFSNLENTAGEDVYGGFGDGLTATNALVDGPVDASNKVRTVTTTAGGNTWKGVFFRPQTHYIDLTSTKTVSVKVYSSTASYFKGIIQAGVSDQQTIELATSEAHTGSGWETLTFTFPTATGEWGEFALRTNVDANGALIDPAVEVLEAHFDDLTAAQGSEVPAPAAGPTTAATAPTAGAADVISIFSDSYTGTAPASWSQEWGDGTLEDDLVIDGNTSKHYSDLLFQAINLNGNVDLSSYTTVHIDVYTESANVFKFKLQNFGANGTDEYPNADDTEAEVVSPTAQTAGEWVSHDIPLSSFIGDGKLDSAAAIGQIQIVLGEKADIWIDNIYFYKEPTASETTVLQDFSNLENTAGEDVYGGFGDGLTATNALVDGPVDASNKVRTVTTTAGGNTWKGVFFRPQTHYIDLTSTKTVSVKVYSSTASYFKGIIQAGVSDQQTIELATSEAHTGSGWETLTFTFPTATGEWGEFALRTNVDANGALIDPAVEVLEAHFDDLTAAQGSEVPAPAAGPTTAATAPTAGAADVISIFSDSYTGTAPASWSQEWGDGTLEDDLVIDGNTSKHYSDLLFQAINLNGNVDLSSYTTVHIDVYTESANVFKFKLQNFGANGTDEYPNADDTEAEVVSPTAQTAGEWVSHDIPLSSFIGDGKLDSAAAIGQIQIVLGEKADIWIDNIYFYKEPTASETTVLQDFSNLENTAGEDVYGGFGDGLTATNALVDGPVDASNKVRTVTTTAGGNTWKGVFFRPQTHYIDLTSTKTVSVKVYSTTASYFKGKIQAGQSSQGDIELTTSEAHTGSGWETLTFTFPTATGEWGEFVIYTNVDANGALIDPAVEVLEAHFDDLTAAQGSEVPAPAAGPTTAATPPPTRDAADVISIYSDAYTAATTISAVDWDDSDFEEVSIAGDNVLKIAGENFLAIVFGDYLDATNMTNLHMDYWIADDWQVGQVLNPKLSNHAAQAGETNALDIGNPIVSQAEVQNWQSKDFVLTGDRESLKEFIFTVAGRTDLYYLDNVYLYKDASAGVNDSNIINVSVYPNPSNSDWKFRTPSTVINSVEVFNLLGKRVASQKSNNNTEVSISTQGLTSGIYIARITTEQGTKSVKLIKN